MDEGLEASGSLEQPVRTEPEVRLWNRHGETQQAESDNHMERIWTSSGAQESTSEGSKGGL